MSGNHRHFQVYGFQGLSGDAETFHFEATSVMTNFSQKGFRCPFWDKLPSWAAFAGPAPARAPPDISSKATDAHAIQRRMDTTLSVTPIGKASNVGLIRLSAERATADRR